MEISVSVRTEAIRQFLERLPDKIQRKVLRRGLSKAATQLRRRIRGKLPRGRTGRVRASVRRTQVKTRGGVTSVMVFSNWFITRFLEQSGAKPHAIKPKNAKALSIGDVFRASVSHPGFRARPVWGPEKERLDLPAIMTKELEKVLKERT